MITVYQWISLAQWAIMAVASVLLWRMRTSVKDAVGQADHERRIKGMEAEVERLRDWRHKELVPWQQILMDKMDERYVTRREVEAINSDSPWPDRRKRPR